MTTIHITQDNIDHGLRGSSTQDPVALALRDAGFIRPFVGIYEIRLKSDRRVGGHITVPLPLAIQDFIAMFDQGEKVEPLTVKIDL